MILVQPVQARTEITQPSVQAVQPSVQSVQSSVQNAQSRDISAQQINAAVKYFMPVKVKDTKPLPFSWDRCSGAIFG